MRLVPWLGLLAAVGCGGVAVHSSDAASGMRGTASRSSGAAVPFESDSAFASARRRFVSMRRDEAGRRELLSRLLAHLARRCARKEAYEDRVACLGEAAELLDPVDFEAARLPAPMRPLAEGVLPDAARRGDEAVALSAHLLLSFVSSEEEAARHRRAHERIVHWGEAVRRRLDPMERWERLSVLWDRHAELSPAFSVLRKAAQVHLDGGRALQELLGSQEGRFWLVQRALRRARVLPPDVMQRLPFEAAAPLLAHGRLREAATLLERARVGGEAQRRALLGVIRSAAGDDPDRAAKALLRLADLYLEAMPSVAWGLCREGMRRGFDRARFTVCLGRVDGQRGREREAAAWFARALEAEPEERELYDEALRSLASFLDRAERTLGQEAEALQLAREAEGWLARRMQRWPDVPAPLRKDELDYLVARLAVRRGDLSLARGRFESVSRAGGRLAVDAWAEWGEMELRAGEFERARRLLRRALDALADRRDADRSVRRAELLSAIADAWRLDGNEERAVLHYREALRIWDASLSQARGRARAEAWVRRGVLEDRLGRPKEAEEDFVRAVRAAPDERSVYAGVLAHLVTMPRGRTRLALRLYEKARRQAEWDDAWRVYLGLWCWAVAVRDGAPLPDEVARALRRAAGQQGWHAKLASLFEGRVTAERLLASASGRGERAEAHFYAAVRAAAEGDERGVRVLLRAVLEDRMVSFYEHAMAQEWLGETASASRGAS